MYTIRYLFTKTTKKYINEAKILLPMETIQMAPFEFIYENGHAIGLLALNISNELYEKVKNWPERIEGIIIKINIKKIPKPDIYAIDRDKEFLILYEKNK